MYVALAGLRKSNSTPAMVESSGVVSLETMKISTGATGQFTNDDDQSWNIKRSAEKSQQLLHSHTDQYNDVKSSFVGDESSEQTSNDHISNPCNARMTSNLGDKQLPPLCSYISRSVETPKFADSSDYGSLQKMISPVGQKSVCLNDRDISCSLPSFPLKPSFAPREIISNKSTSNFELTQKAIKPIHTYPVPH